MAERRSEEGQSAPAMPARRSSCAAFRWGRVATTCRGLASCLLLVWRSPSCGSSAGRSRPTSSSRSSSAAESQASYTLDRVGFRTQKVSNLVIGDPSRPDLVARTRDHPDADQARRQRRGLSHRRARRPAARPAGRRQGPLGPDRQIAPAAERQAVQAARASRSTSPTAAIALATPFGPVGIALEGNGNLTRRVQGPRGARQPALDPRSLPRPSSCAPTSRSRSWRAGRRSTDR